MSDQNKHSDHKYVDHHETDKIEHKHQQGEYHIDYADFYKDIKKDDINLNQNQNNMKSDEMNKNLGKDQNINK
jgi:hypothetical protein